MMSKTAAEPLVRISKREGTTFVQKVLVRAIAILLDRKSTRLNSSHT